jgi:hypothetical protein
VAKRSGEGHFVKADRIAAVIDWWALLGQRLRLRDVVLDGVDVELVRDENGRLNIADLMEGDAAPKSGDGGDGMSWITQGRIEGAITNTRFAYRDRGGGTATEILVEEIRIPLVVSAALAIDGASMNVNQGPVALEKVLFPLADDGQPFEVKLQVTNVRITTQLPEVKHGIPLLYTGGRSTVGGTIESLKLDLRGKGLQPQQLKEHLQGTVHLVAKGGQVSTRKGIGPWLLKALGYNSIEFAKVDTGVIQIGDGRIRSDGITITSPQADITLRGHTTLDGHMSYKMAVNPKASIPGDKKERLAKVNALLRSGILAFKIEGPVGQARPVPDPAGSAEGFFVSIFGKPTNNPFVRDGSLIQRIGDLIPRPSSLPALPLPRLPSLPWRRRENRDD